MAMMASEGTVVQQKTPVPSEKMAVDIDINGNPNRDATLAFDLDTTPPDFATKTVDISPSNELASGQVEMEGRDHSIHSVAANQTIPPPSIDVPAESQPTEDFSTSFQHSNPSTLPDTHTTSSGVPSQSQEAPHISALASAAPESGVSAAESAAETAITSALKDTSATSTVPPVVEAIESDLRDTTSALALAPQPNLDQPRIPDFQVETEFSNHDMDGVMNDVGDAIYNTDMETHNADAAIPAPAFQTLTLNNGVTDHIAPTDALPAEDAVSSFVDEQHTVRDAEMTDPPVSASSTKVARERDDDNDDEPSAKRTKVEDDTNKTDIQSQQFPAAPEVPATAQDQDVAPVRSESITTITPYESKEIIKILKNVVRTANGKNFRKSVRALWPNFADAYYAKIPHPVDLLTMENNLKEEKYPSMDDFKAEVDLLYENAVTFNGENHEVTASAKVVRDAILSKMASIPPEAPEVAKAPKKQARRKSTPLAEPAPRIVTPRRQSKSGGTAAVAATTFALDPNTSTPLIRRDSTKGDGGRPKREIHPPKNKDLPYNTTARPKNKKVAQELKFCEEVLAELKKPKHSSYSNAFMFPVDPVSLNIPNYFQVIKHPMDISKIEEKLKGGQYQSAKAFEADVKLMFSNCYKFNPPSNVVHHWGKQFEEVFNQTLATKSKWFEDHAPAATPSSHGDSDDEESEEEAEAEEPALGIAAWSERLTEEQDKMITLMANPKKNAQLIDMQNDMIDMIKKKIANEKAKPVPKKEIKKPKAVRPAKKQAVAKKAAPAAKRKSTGGRQRYMGTHEKNIISIGIQQLPEDITKDILAMIKGETDVDEGADGEVELDIDVVSVQSLWVIYDYVMKYAPHVVDEAREMLDDQEEEAPPKLAKPPAKKKNKPMTRTEQERKIEQLEGTLETFQRHASGSQEPIRTVERHQDQPTPDDESSGDNSDSEED